jgi:outer membrane protein assembly factor BamB
MRTGFVVFLLAVASTAAARAGDRWPQFRGNGAVGISQEERSPDRWSERENLAWVAEIPGRGWSSPIVWGKRLFLTSAISAGAFKEPTPGIYGNDYIAELRAQGLADDEVMRRVRARDNEVSEEVSDDVRYMVYAIDVDSGKPLWEALAHKGKPFGGRHRKNTYASETLATDGERVYAYFGNVGVFAYSLAGEPLWTVRLEPKRTYLDFGTASSPVVHDGRVYVLNDNEEGSYLLALDAATGRELWRAARDFGATLTRTTFTTPFVWRNRMRTEIVTLAPRAVASYDLAGRELWRFTGTSVVGAPTPVANEDLLIVGSGSPSEDERPLIAFRPGASGDVSLKAGEESNAFVAWRQRRGGSYITSPLLYGTRVYVLFDQGFFGAFEAASGRQLYKARFPEGTPTFSSSPWAHKGGIYCLSEQGDTYVVEAGDEFKLLRRNSLGEMSLATPALAHDSLFLRTATRLYRISP